MTLKEFIAGNKDAGLHFFDKETMRFFRSEVHKETWDGDGYFITSEQSADDSPRMYSIRKGSLEDFGVDTIAGFQRFKNKKDALKALREIRGSVNA